MNQVLLKFVMLFTPLWRSLGADTVQLKAILTMRLMLDDRRPVRTGLASRSRNEKKERRNGSLIGAFVFAVMGLLYAGPVLVIPDRVFGMTLNFSLMFLMVTLTLITDFSNAMFDNRDKYIIFPRPVGDRTIVLAKLLHIFIYLLRMVLPMSLATIAALARKDGAASACLYLLPLVLLVCLALFVVNSVYLIILQLASPEKFKDIISYFQILASIIFFGLVYLRPRTMFYNVSDRAFDFSGFHWLQYLPPYWLATLWNWLGYPSTFGNSHNILWNTLAIVPPLLGAFVLVKWLAPRFNQKISGIDGAEVSQARPAAAGGTTGTAGKTYLVLANLFNHSSEARAGFIISWLQTSRSRAFRMRIYPYFAFIPIYFIYLLSQNGTSVADVYEHLGESSSFLLLLYMSSIVLINGMNYMIVSDQFKSAWVYYASPAPVPGRIMIGALTAMWVKFFLPFFSVLAVFCLWIWGIGIWSDVLLALVNVTLIAVSIARVSYRQLPFSMQEQAKQKGGRVVRGLLSMFVPLILGFGHYFSIHLWWLKLVFIILSSILLWLVWDSYAGTTWEHINQEELAG